MDTVARAASGPVDDINPARGDVCHGVGRGGDGAGSGISIILGNQPGNNLSIRVRINYRFGGIPCVDHYGYFKYMIGLLRT